MDVLDQGVHVAQLSKVVRRGLTATASAVVCVLPVLTAPSAQADPCKDSPSPPDSCWSYSVPANPPPKVPSPQPRGGTPSVSNGGSNPFGGGILQLPGALSPLPRTS